MGSNLGEPKSNSFFANDLVILPIERRVKLREIKRIKSLCEANCRSTVGKFVWGKKKSYSITIFARSPG